MNAIRVTFVGGQLAYRALFNWLPPATFVPTMIVAPLLQLAFFTYLGRHTGAAADDGFFVVGNAIQASALATIYGVALTVGNERYFGTLPALLASPANRVAMLGGRALPLIANGMLVAAGSLAVGALAFGVSIPARACPALAAALAVGAASGAAVGLLLGAAGLRGRDVFLLANVTYSLLTILANVNIPVDRLPAALRAASTVAPLRYATDAGRAALRGAPVLELLGREALLMLGYGGAALLALAVFERAARRSGSPDRI